MDSRPERARVPISDLGDLVRASSHDTLPHDVLHRVADEVNIAFKEHGFLMIRNHGVPDDTINRVLRAAQCFFLDTPSAKKNLCAYRAPVPRGFTGVRRENFAILAGQRLPNDLVEKYRMGPWRFDANDPYYSADMDAQMMFYLNKWPGDDDKSGIQAAMEEYYVSVERLAALLFRVFASCLNLPSSYFEPRTDRHTSILSVNHYPPVSKQVQKGQLRLAEHTDVDLFTILCPDYSDHVGCLEVKDTKDQAWASVPVVPGTLIVNIGDGFNHWTRGHWRSTPHRVIIPKEPEARSVSRFAIGYFVGANYDALMSKLPVNPVSQDYDEVTYARWRKNRIQKAMAQLSQK